MKSRKDQMLQNIIVITNTHIEIVKKSYPVKNVHDLVPPLEKKKKTHLFADFHERGIQAVSPNGVMTNEISILTSTY